MFSNLIRAFPGALQVQYVTEHIDRDLEVQNFFASAMEAESSYVDFLSLRLILEMSELQTGGVEVLVGCKVCLFWTLIIDIKGDTGCDNNLASRTARIACVAPTGVRMRACV